MCSHGICQDHDVKAPRSCCHVHNVMQNSKWLFEAVRGMPTLTIPGFTLRHARTVASRASSSVKSHVSSNKATPRKGRVVPTLLTARFSCAFLTGDFDSGTFRRYSCQWPGAHGEEPTSGWDSSTIPIENPFLQEC